MPAPASTGVIRSFLHAAKDVMLLPSWWRQQAWVINTELLMGFLAAWGVVRGMQPALVALGIGVVYATNSLGIWVLRTHGRRGGVGLVTLAFALLAITGFVGGAWRWQGLCLTVGVLLAFRDLQTVHSMAWLPVRARRRGTSSLMNLTAGAVCGAVVLAIAFVLGGFISQHWKWLPHALVCVAFVGMVPQQLMRMGVGWRKRPPSTATLPVHDRELSWLLKLAVSFNAVNFLGRRLVLPAAILAVATTYGDAKSAMPLLGAALGLMGVVGSLARMPLVLSSNVSGRTLLRWGARASLFGWVTVAWGLALWTWMGSSWALIPMMMGWGLLEITNRTWAVAYMEALRESAVGSRFSASRSHRRALHRFMVRKAAGGAVGCAAGGLVAAAWLPAVVIALAMGCWTLLEQGPGDNPAGP